MKKVILVVLTIIVTGCTSFGTTELRTEGVRIDRTRVAEIRPGVTTRQMIINTFGTPSNINAEGNVERFVYVYKKKRVPVYLGGLVKDERHASKTVATLEIILENGIVKSYKFRSAEEER